MTYYTYEHTPAGDIMLVGDEHKLSAVYWQVYRYTPEPQDDWIEDRSKFKRALQQLHEYFAGTRTAFDIPTETHGTQFQESVWHELERIGYGETRSYQQIANAIGTPGSARAVGAAVGRNPLSIIIPCHRIVGSNGALTGFAGGIEAKRSLLELEGAAPATLPSHPIAVRQSKRLDKYAAS